MRKLARSARLLALLVAAAASIALFQSYTTLSGSSLYTNYKVHGTDPCACTCRSYSPKHSQHTPYAYIVNSQSSAPSVIDPGQCVCVRVVIPPPTGNNSTVYRPIPAWPADGVSVDLVMQSSQDPLYVNARVAVPINLRARVDDSNPAETHVYEGTARLYDPGTYAIDARLEHRNGQWNAEPGQFTPKYSESLIPTLDSQITVRQTHRHSTYLGRHQNLPLCVRGDARGRWIPEINLPWHWHPWQYMFPVEDGRVWLPYHCRLRRVSYPEFAFHMSYAFPSVHWYGDSNSRRTLRPFMVGGKWCHENTTNTRLDCLCNDAPKDLFPADWYHAMPNPHWYRVRGQGVDLSMLNTDLRLVQEPPTDPRPIPEKDPVDDDPGCNPDYMPPGYSNRRDYFDLYYLFTRGTNDMHGSYWDRDITTARVSQYPRPQLVVFQMVTWDAAYSSFADFVAETARLVIRLKSVYPKAQFIYRSGPYWCCRNAEDQDKKYSRLRFQAFDQHARLLFQKHLNAWVWDVMTPASSRSPESRRLPENMPCKSAHSRAEHIHVDNQILMNMIVNSL